MSGDQHYYDVLAATVRFKDITSSAHNRALLYRIANSDPYLDFIVVEGAEGEEDADDERVFEVRDGDDLGWLGYFIGENISLKQVSIAHLPGNRDRLFSFFKGVERNKSIRLVQCLRHNIADNDEGLSAMRMPHLKSINVFCWPGRWHTHYFALGLRHFKSLERYEGVLTGEIMNALESLTMIKYIGAYSENNGLGSNLDKEGCIALEKLVRNATNLTSLNLSGMTIGNVGLKSLAAGLVHSNSLRECALPHNNIGDEGVKVLAVSLSINHSVRKLNLSGNNITDVGIASFASSLVNSTGICELDISGNTAISEMGLSAISRTLQSPKCKLESLNLNGLNIRGAGLELLGSTLSINKSIVSLELCCEDGVTSIGNDGLRALMAGLRDNDTLQSLDLSGNTAINATGLSHFKQYFWSESCALEELLIIGINVGDGGAFALADALARNKSLKRLLFRPEQSGITVVGGSAFSKLLCDPTSASSIYLSNHTLQTISTPNYPDFVPWLGVNMLCNNPRMAAKCKMLWLFPDLDFNPLLQWNLITPLLQWNLKCLPLVIDWLQTITFSPNIISSHVLWGQIAASIPSRELSTIYKFVGGMPGLVVKGYRRYLNQQFRPID